MRTLLLFVALLAIAVPVCADECVATTSDPEVDTGETGVGRFYVDNDVCQPECLFSIWLYQETNGVDGLQREDEVHDDTCGGVYEGDSLHGF
ncbi:MAG TPA: hypothetical protein VM370_12480 [Candidatus Thermoplasmatota archaeon]|nr:hypothetical protein [Candidatus Thermoplasmatota archaeon]